MRLLLQKLHRPQMLKRPLQKQLLRTAHNPLRKRSADASRTASLPMQKAATISRRRMKPKKAMQTITRAITLRDAMSVLHVMANRQSKTTNNLTVMADRQNATISNVASVRTTLHAVQIRIASRIERRMERAPQQNPLPMCQQ